MDTDLQFHKVFNNLMLWLYKKLFVYLLLHLIFFLVFVKCHFIIVIFFLIIIIMMLWVKSVSFSQLKDGYIVCT